MPLPFLILILPAHPVEALISLPSPNVVEADECLTSSWCLNALKLGTHTHFLLHYVDSDVIRVISS